MSEQGTEESKVNESAGESVQFGVTTETKSRNQTPIKAGFTKAILTKVVKEIVGKDENNKFTILTFYFIDIEGIGTYKHTEWIIKPTENKAKDKQNWLNSRIKHLYEAYAPFPANGIGVGATSWEDFFDKVASAFNTGNNGIPIYQRTDKDKTLPIVTWIKLTYYKQELKFPNFPNFIERVTENNIAEPKILFIDKKTDVIKQPDSAPTTPILGATPGVVGSGSKDDFGF